MSDEFNREYTRIFLSLPLCNFLIYIRIVESEVYDGERIYSIIVIKNDEYMCVWLFSTSEIRFLTAHGNAREWVSVLFLKYKK